MKLYQKRTIELLPKEGRILIFHHWDTDGISSGALVADFIQTIGDYKIDFVYPDVGTFEISLGKNVKIPNEKYAAGFLLDYSVPPEDILLLQKRLEAPLIVFDHHLKLAPDKEEILYINPVARGEHGSSWPATTLVVTEGLGLEPSNYTLLGIAGDYGHKFLKSYIDSFPKIKNFLKESGIPYEKFVDAADLIDSNYKLNDREALKNIASEILRLEGNPLKILQNKDWILKLEKVKKEVDFMIGRPADEFIGDALEIRKISTSYSLISELTRRLAAKTDKDFVLVADLGFFEEFVQIYIRRSEKNNFSTDIFRETALSLGARVGGKEEVAGIIIDRKDFEAYLDKLRKIFSDDDDSTT